MLQPYPEVVVPAAQPDADVIAELEMRTQGDVGLDMRVRQEMQADRGFEVRTAFARARIAKHRRHADVIYRAFLGRPVAERRLEKHVHVMRLELLQLVIRVHADAQERHLSIALAQLERKAVRRVRGEGYEEQRRGEKPLHLGK